MGGVNNHRLTGRHGLHQALVQPLLDSGPGSLHRGIDEHHGADGIGGEHQGRRLPRAAQ
jgi:hypothetical protein